MKKGLHCLVSIKNTHEKDENMLLFVARENVFFMYPLYLPAIQFANPQHRATIKSKPFKRLAFVRTAMNCDFCIPRKGIALPQSQFPHLCVCEQSITCVFFE